MDGQQPSSINSAMLASMREAQSGLSAGTAIPTGGSGLATTIGSQNFLDTVSQTSNLDHNFAVSGGVKAPFTGGEAVFNQNIVPDNLGTLAPAAIGHNLADPPKLIGDASLSSATSPQVALNMPKEGLGAPTPLSSSR